MKKSTRHIIKILLDDDETVTVEHERNIWEAVTNRPKAEPSPPLLLTQMQAAEMLSVSRFTVRKLVSGGHLKTVSVLGATRYRRQDVCRIVERGTDKQTD